LLASFIKDGSKHLAETTPNTNQQNSLTVNCIKYTVSPENVLLSTFAKLGEKQPVIIILVHNTLRLDTVVYKFAMPT